MTEIDKKDFLFQESLGAGGGGRTHTVSPPRDFESRTSANSITPASSYIIVKTQKKIKILNEFLLFCFVKILFLIIFCCI